MNDIAQQTDGLIVVGVGASAGGLEALERMFDTVPGNCGMAFVVVQHLSPDFKSLMNELLGRHTQMKIHPVKDGMSVAANAIYLIPPKQDMTIDDEILRLVERVPKNNLPLPIDLFLSSLAASQGPRSVAVILSGTGSDGTRGVKEISAAGGLVIAQSPESAKFDGMPQSAIDTGCVDIIKSPDAIAEMLVDFAVHRDVERLRKSQVPENQSALQRIFFAVKRQHGVDFSAYRPTTIGRRIERRIEIQPGVDNLSQYADLVEQDADELESLFSYVLINVTNFFRDSESYEGLSENVLTPMLQQHSSDIEFRVWVAACATGEEAYSIAILIDECLRKLKRHLTVKIFATDIDKEAIDIATLGCYPVDRLTNVSEKRKSRYFHRTKTGYQITPDIRRMVVFAPHNLIKDPPFKRVNLVTCRNFLIYLLPKWQEAVLAYLHFGLKIDGCLMLGSSETPGVIARDYEVINARQRLYRKFRNSQISPVLTAGTMLARTNNLHQNKPASIPTTSTNAVPTRVSSLTYEEIYQNFMPTGFVIDCDGNLLQVFRDGGKFLRVREGVMTSTYADLVSEDLRIAISGAIQGCTNRGEPTTYQRLQICQPDGTVGLFKLRVTPLPRCRTPEKFVVAFEPIDAPQSQLDENIETLHIDDVSKQRLAQLEHELRHNREVLQATIEELETSNEELQSTNEELIASNEELQSSNEELHSVNEELFTVNAEYQRKIDELMELTQDFENLHQSADVHTLFLDQDLQIRRFTPGIAKVFNLVPHDIGRRLDAFLSAIDCKQLPEKLSQVLETSEPIEERVIDSKASEFLMRLLPYQAKGTGTGIVMALIDISKLVAAEKEATVERERFQRAIQANRDGTWDWPDTSDPKMWWSPQCYQLLGYEPDEFEASHSQWLKLIHPDDRNKILATTIPNSDQCFVEVHRNFEYRMLHANGKYRWFRHCSVVDLNAGGRAIRMTGSIADIQSRKEIEIFASEEIRLRDNFLAMLSHELRNPMGAITSAVENIHAKSDSRQTAIERPPHQHEIAVIQRQTHHMARLLDDLLDVARFGRDRIEFRKEPIDLRRLVDDIVESVGYQLQQKNQTIDTQVEDAAIRVLGDPARLIQAQTNLIINASKFSEPGQSINYRLGSSNGDALIVIKDHGIGIEPEMIGRVFELFVQSPSSLDRSAGGIGVGLSLSQKIIEAHRGSIEVTSQGKGQGSQFTIRIPLTQLPVAPPVKETTRDNNVSGKIMLVEDNFDAREMLARALERRGYQVGKFADGKSALEGFSSFLPDAAVIDVGLPKISGFEVASTIRENHQWDCTLLIALTGYGQKKDKQAVFAAGFDHHLIKPAKISELNQLLQDHLLNTTVPNSNAHSKQ